MILNLATSNPWDIIHLNYLSHDVNDVILLFLLLTWNIFHILF